MRQKILLFLFHSLFFLIIQFVIFFICITIVTAVIFLIYIQTKVTDKNPNLPSRLHIARGEFKKNKTKKKFIKSTSALFVMLCPDCDPCD